MSFPIFFFTLLPLLFHYSRCTTVIVDGSSEWKNPTVHIGDSISEYYITTNSTPEMKKKSNWNLCNKYSLTLATNIIPFLQPFS